MQILKRFRRKIEFNEDVEELEDSFKEGCGDADEVILIVSQAVVKFEKKKMKYTQEITQVLQR